MNHIERLVRVLKETENTIHSLARKIGLKRSQSLYDIMKGKLKSISYNIAARINLIYPQYSIEWLATGQDDGPVNEKSETESEKDKIILELRNLIDEKEQLIRHYKFLVDKFERELKSKK